MENWKKIRVDKNIKPVHYTNRKSVELIIGKNYFVSFGNNMVNNCTLINVEETRNPKAITIEIPVKPGSKKGYIDRDGKISHNWVRTHSLFADEIGITPEEAVTNQVTS